MATNKKIKQNSFYTNYKPENPHDPKIPNLHKDWNPSFFVEQKIKKEISDDVIKKHDKKNIVTIDEDYEEPRLVTAAFESLAKIPNANNNKKNKIITVENNEDFANIVTSMNKKKSKSIEDDYFSDYKDIEDDVNDGSLLTQFKKNDSDIKKLLQKIVNEEIDKNESSIYSNELIDEAIKTPKKIKENRNEDGYIMPDPNSVDKIKSYKDIYNRNNNFNFNFNNKYSRLSIIKKSIVSKKNKDTRATLTNKQINFICNEFKFKVIKITKKEVLIKHLKFCYEIYFNTNDDRWWVVAGTLAEPYISSPSKSIIFNTLWSGASYIGYGSDSLENVILKTKNMFISGRTGNVVIKEYLIKYDIKHKRIYVSNEPTILTHDEYSAFSKWFKKNRIEVFLKTYGKLDSEDLDKKAYEQKKRGVKDMATVLGGKIADAPRKANYIFSYPVAKPKTSKTKVEEPDKKMYVVAFGITE